MIDHDPVAFQMQARHRHPMSEMAGRQEQNCGGLRVSPRKKLRLRIHSDVRPERNSNTNKHWPWPDSGVCKHQFRFGTLSQAQTCLLTPHAWFMGGKPKSGCPQPPRCQPENGIVIRPFDGDTSDTARGPGLGMAEGDSAIREDTLKVMRLGVLAALGCSKEPTFSCESWTKSILELGHFWRLSQRPARVSGGQERATAQCQLLGIRCQPKIGDPLFAAERQRHLPLP